MLSRFLRDLDGFAYVIAIGLIGIICLAGLAVPGVVGWYVGHHFWNHGDVGAFVPYVLAGIAYGLTEERIRAVYGWAVAAFVLSVPVIYLLVLVVRLVLLWSSLVRYPSVQSFFLTCLPGVLIGCGVSIAFTLKGTFNKAAENGLHLINDYFLAGLAFRVPSAFLIASLTNLPESAAARIVVGTFWGIVAAISALIHNGVVDGDPVKAAGIYIVITEVLLLLGTVGGVLDGLFRHHKTLAMTLEVTPTAGVACALTYLLAWLGAMIIGRA